MILYEIWNYDLFYYELIRSKSVQQPDFITVYLCEKNCRQGLQGTIENNEKC